MYIYIFFSVTNIWINITSSSFSLFQLLTPSRTVCSSQVEWTPISPPERYRACCMTYCLPDLALTTQTFGSCNIHNNRYYYPHCLYKMKLRNNKWLPGILKFNYVAAVKINYFQRGFQWVIGLISKDWGAVWPHIDKLVSF